MPGLRRVLGALALVAAAGPAAAQPPPAETVGSLAFYVHGFDDPSHYEYEMNTTAPGADEQPQTGTCSSCVGDPQVAYNFTSAPLGIDVDLDPSGRSEFEFWIRAYQAQPNVSVPPGFVRVEHALRMSGGPVLGAATVERNVTGGDPVHFNASYGVGLDALPRTAGLRWTVTITGSGGAYNPAAAPYGVSHAFPFAVRLAHIVPVPGVQVDLRANATRAVAEAGRGVEFALELANHGRRPTTSTLAVDGPPPNATIRILRAPDARPVEGPLTVPPGSGVALRLNVTGLPVGNHTLLLRANSTKGVADVLELAVDVRAPAPPPVRPEAGVAGPGATLATLAALAASWTRRRA